MTTTPTPTIVTRYFETSDAGDALAVALCFTPDAIVTDEGHTHRGRDEIQQWVDTAATQWTYTTAVTGAEPADAGYRVFVRIEGDFPGGVADLVFRFELQGDSISALHIGG